MDTRFWGPSGWQLLHLIAASPVTNTQAVYDWFHLLEFVLPCKYCRASFHDYMKLQPLTKAIIEDKTAFSRWIFGIHNRVNDKLRGQGLLNKRNPSWATVRDHWLHAARELCESATPTQKGWDFFTSIAYSTPDSDYKAVPMPDAPEQTSNWSSLDMATRNRYNLMTREERITALTQWWKLLPSILPCAAWRKSWAEAYRKVGEPPLASFHMQTRSQQQQQQSQRKAVMQWMWNVECAVCDGLKCPTPHPSLHFLKKEVGAFESSCSSATGSRRKTCRKTRKRLMRLQKTHKKR